MTEVEKLYELAGVEKEFDYLECHRGTSSICCPLMDYESERDEHCEGCVNSSKMQEVYSYPEFTAEKQIELIKLLAIKGDFEYTLDIAKNTDAYYTMYFDDTRWTCKTFEETLAGLINSMWNKLTEAEHNEIREILK